MIPFSFSERCDMTADGGGWELVHRQVGGSQLPKPVGIYNSTAFESKLIPSSPGTAQALAISNSRLRAGQARVEPMLPDDGQDNHTSAMVRFCTHTLLVLISAFSQAKKWDLRSRQQGLEWIKIVATREANGNAVRTQTIRVDFGGMKS